MEHHLKYFLKEKLSDITTYATILSVIGAIYVCSPEQFTRLCGYGIWICSNLTWTGYFLQTKQYNPMVLFIIYLVTSIAGVLNNW